MKRLGFLLAMAILCLPALSHAADTGLLVRSTCSSITAPVTNQTWCFQQSDGEVYVWTGAAWTGVMLFTPPLTSAYGGTGINTSGSTGLTSVNAGTWSVTGGSGTPHLSSGILSIGSADWNCDAETSLGIVNVKCPAYGATGNGITNDSAAIQAAITAATAAVYFPPGTYLVNTKLNAKANVSLLGSGYGSQIKTTTASNFSLLSLSSAHNVKISDLYFYGNSASSDTATPSIAVDLYRSNNVEISGCWFDNFNIGVRLLDTTVNVNNSTRTNIHDNHFLSAPGPINGGYGILHVRANYTTVHHNQLGPGPIGRHGIYISAGSQWVTVDHNIIQGSTLAGISVNSGTTVGEGISRLTIDGNQIKGNGVSTAYAYGINVTGGITSSKIINNHIDYASNDGIYIQSSSGTILPSDLIISGNSIFNSIGIGMSLYDVKFSIVSNNRLNGNGTGGTAETEIDFGPINDQAGYNDVFGNNITTTLKYGIRLSSNTSSSRVHGNYIYGASIAAVVDSGTANYTDDTGGSATISTGVGSVKMSNANPATNTVWIPFQYNGTTYYVPAWATNTPAP